MDALFIASMWTSTVHTFAPSSVTPQPYMNTLTCFWTASSSQCMASGSQTKQQRSHKKMAATSACP
eukprot:1953364-Amphidinium_carterae.1